MLTVGAGVSVVNGASVVTEGVVVSGITMVLVVVVAVPVPLLLPHAVATRAMPANIAVAVTRRIVRIPLPSSVSGLSLDGYHPVGLWRASEHSENLLADGSQHVAYCLAES